MLVLLLSFSWIFTALAADPTRPGLTDTAGPAAPPPEIDLPFDGSGSWKLHGHAVELIGTTLRVDGAVVIEEVYDHPVAGRDLLLVPCDTPDRAGRVVLLKMGVAGPELREIVVGGRPDRLALSPSGELLAFVSGRSGFASVWMVPLRVGADAVQITNRNLVRTPGSAPAGWVPPPIGAPTFSGNTLRWNSPSGPVEVAWR